MKKLLFVTVVLAACGNSEPPKAPESAAVESSDAAAPAAAPAKGDAGALTPDKK